MTKFTTGIIRPSSIIYSFLKQNVKKTERVLAYIFCLV